MLMLHLKSNGTSCFCTIGIKSHCLPIAFYRKWLTASTINYLILFPYLDAKSQNFVLITFIHTATISSHIPERLLTTDISLLCFYKDF